MNDSVKPSKKRAAPAQAEGFPSVRYFQVHFEHLHEQLAALTEQVQGLEAQLARTRRAETGGKMPKPRIRAPKPATPAELAAPHQPGRLN